MLLGKPLAVFIERSPVSVMVSATLERVFEPAVLDQVFQEHAVLGYAKELAFSSVFKSCATWCSRNRRPWGRSTKLTRTKFR